MLLLRWAEHSCVSTAHSLSSMLHTCSTAFWKRVRRRGFAAGRLKNYSELTYSDPEGLFARHCSKAVTVAGRETILPEDLPQELKRPSVNSEPIAEATSRAAHSNLNERSSTASTEDLETARLRSILDTHQWKRAEAARALGISRATLWRRVRELRLA